LIPPSSVGAAIEVVRMVLLDPSSAVVRDVPGERIRLTLSAPEGAPAVAELAPVSGVRLKADLSNAGPARRRGDSSAERGQHTIPMMRANAKPVIASHRISPANPTRLFRAVGAAFVDMIHLL